MKVAPSVLAIGALLLLLLGTLTATVLSLMLNADEIGEPGVLPSFSSRAELERFLESTGYAPQQIELLLPRGALPEAVDLSYSVIDHSATNVQVEGVDEADIVKTDGRHLYLLSSERLAIVEAYPPESMRIVSSIDRADLLDERYEAERMIVGDMHGIFLSLGRLVVISNAYIQEEASADDDRYYIQVYPRISRIHYTLLSVFDLEEIESPRLLFTVGISGYYSAARMIGDKVYLVSQSGTWRSETDILLPEMYDHRGFRELKVGKIYYDPQTTESYSFINFMAVDTGDGRNECISIVADRSSTVYMSHESLYLTIQKWVGRGDFKDSAGLADWDDSVITTIYKIRIQGLVIKAVASGDVKGWLLNQFSMDEHDSHLRVATTTSSTTISNSDRSTTSSNNVYVLDSEMKIVGSLERLAPTERIFAARFLGDTLYLVTFRQIDPFFVIDLSDPENPRVLGELKIPGFSSYLHPVGEDYILGIGDENQTVKVSLFDVSNPMDPVEVSKVQVGLEGYSYTDVGWDHKALLFSPDRELLVIPVHGYFPVIGEVDSGAGEYASLYRSLSCVLRVSTQEGIAIRGYIPFDAEYGWWYRNLYIGDYLYAVSSSTIQVHRIDDLSAVSSLTYYQPPDWSVTLYREV